MEAALVQFFIIILTCLCVSVPVALSSSCKSSDDCQVEGAVCIKSSCTCPPEHIANSVDTQCLPIAYGVGASCTDNLQCSASLKSGGFCNDGKCDCEPGFHYFLGHCWKTSGLNEKCYSDENCFVGHDFESAVCAANKVCVCKEGYYQREYSSCRLAGHKPGDPCGIPTDCQFPHSTCSWDHVCAASGEAQDATPAETSHLEEFSQVADDEIVLHGVSFKVGDKCEESSACPANSRCSTGGQCICDPGFYTLDQTTCFPEVGAKCSSDGDCRGRYTFCKNNEYCACTEGHVISADRRSCDKLSRHLGWSCLRDAWCAYFGPQSVCINKQCACSNITHYVPEQMYCWTTKKAGEHCENSLDCGLSGMTCKEGICSCLDGFHPSSSGTECRSNSLAFGDNCHEHVDCMFSNSACNSTAGKCVCETHYTFDGTSCKPGIGGPCSVKSTCHMDNSQCVNSSCACAKGFVANSDNSKCLPLQGQIDGACEDSSQCSSLGAHCSDGKCKCSEGYHYVEGWKCFKTVKLGERCSRNGECSASQASCLKYVCTCDRGFAPDGLICSGSLPDSTSRGLVALLVILVLIAGRSLVLHYD